MTFRLPHLIAALVLHVVLLGLIVGGTQCSGKTHRPPVINAVLLDPSRQELAQQKRREQQRREEEARRAEQQRQALAQAAAKKKKADEARKAKLAADQKKAAEQKKTADQKKAAEQKKVTEKQQAETQARLAAEERARLAAVMAAEETQRAADRAAGERDARLAEWAIALTRHVAKNWVRPPSTGDFECRVRVQLLPDGTVTNAKIEKSCGSAQLDRSVEDAVYRASPLPKPSDPSVFDRDLTIRFVPQS